MGMPSIVQHLQPANNLYKNPFGTEIALFRTSEGGTARMAVSWDTPGAGGEMGRVRGQRGYVLRQKYDGLENEAARHSNVRRCRPSVEPAATAARTAT